MTAVLSHGLDERALECEGDSEVQVFAVLLKEVDLNCRLFVLICFVLLSSHLDERALEREGALDEGEDVARRRRRAHRHRE